MFAYSPKEKLPSMGFSGIGNRQAGYFTTLRNKIVFVAIGIMHVVNTQAKNDTCVFLNCGKPTLF